MEKSCDNCCWKYTLFYPAYCVYSDARVKEKICDKHNYKCQNCGMLAVENYKGKYYCEDCLIQELE